MQRKRLIRFNKCFFLEIEQVPVASADFTGGYGPWVDDRCLVVMEFPYVCVFRFLNGSAQSG